MRSLALVVTLLAAIALVPASSAQDHEHGDGARVLLLHDAPEGGVVFVGERAAFGFALVDADGAPIEHHDAHFAVAQAGRVLFRTEDAHEYDGVFTFHWTFAEPGPYEVAAVALSRGEVVAEAAFAGVAVAAETAAPVTVALEGAGELSAGAPSTFRVSVLDADGAPVPHATTLVELRRAEDALLVLRAMFHSHDGAPAEFSLLFPTPGTYDARVEAWNAYPEEGRPSFATASATSTLRVGAGLPDAAARTSLPALPRAEADHGESKGPYALHLTTDPTPLRGVRAVGPFSHVRLSALAYDPKAEAALPHVDFAVAVAGPRGVVFASDDLHEFDGRHELLLSGLAPGEYVASVEAAHTRSDWTAVSDVRFLVVPPVLPLTPGPYLVTLDAAEPVAGEPLDLVFSAKNAAGAGLTHTELDVTVLPPDDGPALARFKIHTHGSGEFHATFAPPSEGAWRLLVAPTPLEPRPSLAFGAAGPGRPIVFDLDVLPGLDRIEPATLGDDTVEPRLLPAPALGVLVLAFAALALVRRRR